MRVVVAVRHNPGCFERITTSLSSRNNLNARSIQPPCLFCLPNNHPLRICPEKAFEWRVGIVVAVVAAAIEERLFTRTYCNIVFFKKLQHPSVLLEITTTVVCMINDNFTFRSFKLCGSRNLLGRSTFPRI